MLFPDRYWEDKPNKCIYVLMPKMNQSLRDFIAEHKRKGQYIPMKIVKKIVEEYASVVRKIHSK